MTRSTRSSYLLLLGLVMVAGCDQAPEEPPEAKDPCAFYACGVNAFCVNEELICPEEVSCFDLKPVCYCEDRFTGNPYDGCVPTARCSADTCSGHGACDDSSGTALCECDAGYEGAYCETCSAGYLELPPGSGQCLTEVNDPCELQSCSGHGNCLVDLTGEAYCVCHVAYAGEVCEGCSEGYELDDDGKCKPTVCLGVYCSLRGECIEEGEEPRCECDPDHDAVEDLMCLHEKTVLCTNEAPEHASPVVDFVDITYTDEDGWTTIPKCEWTCDAGFDEIDGACVDSLLVPCMDDAPLGALVSVVLVEIIYFHDMGWQVPPVCEWRCPEDHALEDDACVHTKSVPCLDLTPPLAVPVGDEVEVTYTDEGGWSEPGACPWECQSGYTAMGDGCGNLDEVWCTDVAPVHGTSTLEKVMVAYVEGIGWLPAAPCQWSCDDGFVEMDGACVDTMQVPCDDEDIPDGAVALPAMVEVSYAPTTGWAAPAPCQWTCEEGMAEWQGGCEAEETIVDCALAASEPVVSLGSEIEIKGLVTSGATALAGQAEGLQGLLCVSEEGFVCPMDPDDYDCVELAYVADEGDSDVFVGHTTALQLGTIGYVMAFTVDEGTSWTTCDATGLMSPPVVPGTVEIQ